MNRNRLEGLKGINNYRMGEKRYGEISESYEIIFTTQLICNSFR